MESNRQKIKLLILLIMAMFLISACRSLPFQSPEQALQNRVTRMMAARGDQNWAEVYEYLAPDYKNRVSKENFLGMKRDVLYGDFAVESIKIGPSGNEAVVTVKYDMTVMSFDVVDRRENQEWVKTGGKWYYQMKVGSIMD
ncbi:MAG: nuclear transport factor 2 family protein [Dissulfuribacterales bacterium]